MFHWKKKIELTIRQATILETIQYIDKQEGKEDFLFYLVALLEKFYGKNFTKDERMYLFTKKKELTEIIKDTYLYNVVDIEEKIPSVGEGVPGGPYSSFLLNLSESTHTPIQQIINEFTYEQLREFSRGMIRNANNITEEGKNLNRNRAKNKKFKEENNMDEIRAKLAEMREKRKTKVSVESLFTKTFLQ